MVDNYAIREVARAKVEMHDDENGKRGIRLAQFGNWFVRFGMDDGSLTSDDMQEFNNWIDTRLKSKHFEYTQFEAYETKILSLKPKITIPSDEEFMTSLLNAVEDIENLLSKNELFNSITVNFDITDTNDRCLIDLFQIEYTKIMKQVKSKVNVHFSEYDMFTYTMICCINKFTRYNFLNVPEETIKQMRIVKKRYSDILYHNLEKLNDEDI